jgi:hypothetical protein
MPEKTKRSKDNDNLLRNKEIAYKGAIGKKRKSFCIKYIKNKAEILKKIQADQLKAVSKKGETISCQKRCTYCCLAYMQASVQECEAIVYYLYHNEFALSAFLHNYTDWREKLRQNGDIFKECGQLWQNKTNPGAGEEAQLALQESESRYRAQNIYCPFLLDDLCLIYKVRPFTCAGLVATSPPHWCSPSSPNKAKTYVTRTSTIINKSFYFKGISSTILAFMPLVVYGILKDGYKLLSNIPGLEGLEEAAMESLKLRRR